MGGLEIKVTLITVPMEISLSAICDIDISWEQASSASNELLFDNDGEKLLIQNK
jgi:hypothetical protein